MKKKTLIVISTMVVLSFLILSFLFIGDSSNKLIDKEISSSFDVEVFITTSLINHTYVLANSPSYYDKYLTKDDYSLFSQNIDLKDPIIKFQFKDELVINTNQTGPLNPKTIVIYPTFTSAAYSEPGFYTFFGNNCDESCITDLSFVNPELKYTSSGITTQLLHQIGYDFIDDVDVDKNPEILKNYDTLILLHNEYVTKKMFDAISTHPNIIFLFPNALYAEIEVNHEDQTMTLIRGHNYPEAKILNGFDYEIEEKFHEFEYDSTCLDWEFVRFDNGYALNCYPDAIIWDTPEILSELRHLTLQN